MTLFLVGLALLLVAGACAAGLRPAAARGAYQGLVVAGCVVGAIDPVRVLATGASLSLSVPAALPGGDWRLGIDALSAVFLLVVLGNSGAPCASAANDQSLVPRVNNANTANSASVAVCVATR